MEPLRRHVVNKNLQNDGFDECIHGGGKYLLRALKTPQNDATLAENREKV